MFLFETDRLIIRKLQVEDLLPFHAMESDPEVRKYVGGDLKDLEANRIALNELIAKYKEEENAFWIWAICLKSKKAFVGTAAIIIDENKEAEIGYRFLREHWGHGFGNEICQALIDYGFRQMDLVTIYAYVDVLNTASVKILDACSLTFIKELWNEEEQCTDRYYKGSNPDF